MAIAPIPTSNEIVIDDNKIFNFVWFQYFQNIYKALRGGTKIKLGGLFDVNTTSVGNVGGGADDLISFTFAANTLSTTGDILEIEAWGTYAANGNSKTVTLEFGGQTILTTGAIAANDGSWHIKAKVVRTAAATQEIIAQIVSSNSSVADSATRTAGTQTLTSSLTIKCTGTGTATEDISQKALILNLNPNT